ncbi:hypothetical protein ACNQFZ_10110 [Schinkia sp. CFF1]
MNFFVLRKTTLLLVLTVVVIFAAISVLFLFKPEAVPVFSQQANESIREIDMITAEFHTKTQDGKDMVVQRWDPGTVFLEKGEQVNLYISGINEQDHPFHIEGTDIKGIVKKGETTIVPLQFKEEGTYRLVCDTHAHRDHSIPMIAYIVVD